MIVHRSTEIYLDSNATTPVMPKAATAAFDAMEEIFGNPSSSHTSGLRARSLLESTRNLARSVLGAGDGQIVFTSGATEAIQTAIFSTLCHVRELRKTEDGPDKTENKKRLLLYGSTEHKAIPQALHHWNTLLNIENEVVSIPVDDKGMLDLDFIRQHAADADMICTMAVNNETGVISDLAEIETAIRETSPSCLWLVDCVQAVGKMKLELAQTSIDYAAVSGHKIYAPKGIGLLYCREGKPLTAMMAGGGQESGARGGTENLPGVAAISAVLEELDASPSKTFRDENLLCEFRDQIVSALTDAFPNIQFNTPFESSVPTTINFAVEGFDNKELLDLFDAAGIRVSSGSACGSGVARSYVLDAMGVPCWRSLGAIRLSFGPCHGRLEIESACKKIREAGQALSSACLINSADGDDDSQTTLDGLIQLKRGSDCTWLFMDAESKTCLVVDPFESLAGRVSSIVRCQESKVIAILDSHGHVDHESCRSMLVNVMAESMLSSAQSDDLLGWPENLPTLVVGDGSSAEYFSLGSKLVVAKVDLPGHTTISNAYLVGSLDENNSLPAKNVRFAFTGDTILMGGIGRTDFPCSTITGMYESLCRLPKLINDATVICPTHDYNNELATTLATEARDNEFLASVLDPVISMTREDFIDRKPAIDKGITDETNSELVCGFLKDSSTTVSEANAIRNLKEFLNQHQNSLVIDVREPHEFCFAQDWDELGFSEPPLNVPLTQLAGYLPFLINDKPADQAVVFLCRSGRRSGLAAALAGRLAIKNAMHIHGGLALNTNQTEPDPEFLI